MKAIIWTDVLQALVMYAGVFTVVIQGKFSPEILDIDPIMNKSNLLQHFLFCRFNYGWWFQKNLCHRCTRWSHRVQ